MNKKSANFVRTSPPSKAMKQILLFICLTVCFITPATAQLYQYLNTLDGLSSRRVISIQKDSKGYMWFLTHEGIDRYNGKHYTHYPLLNKGQELKSFPNLNTLEIDTAGVIWQIGKNGFIFRYNALADQYEMVYDFSLTDKSNSGLPLTATYLDSNNQIWLCTKNKQYIFDISQEKLIHLDSPIQDEITCIAEAGDNRYFLGTAHNIYSATLHKANCK